MTELQDQASLHEKTVQAASAHSKAFSRRPRQTEGRPRTSRVSSQQVHPLVWKEALRIAKGDVSRIEVRSVDTVVVR